MAKSQSNPSKPPVVNMSISLLEEERMLFQQKMAEMMQYDVNIRGSKLARIAFLAIQRMEPEEILKISAEVPELGGRRGRPPK